MPEATVGPIGGDTAADDDIQGTGPTVAPSPQPLGDVEGPLDRKQLEQLHAWWRAANYLAVGQIYLLDNPLLREPLRPEHVKPRLLGHLGTTPGLNLVWAHANRLIRQHDLDAVFVAGPGHGGPGPNASAWLEGHLQRAVQPHPPGRAGDAAVLPPVLLPGRGAQPLRTGDPRVVPRGR